MKIRHGIITIIFLTLITFGVGHAFGKETAVVTPGYEPHEADLIGIRFRSFANTGGGELYAGLANLGGGPNRVEADLIWAAENSVTFTFDAAADKLIASVANEHGTTTIEYLDLSATLAKKNHAYTVADLNVMQITLANREKESAAVFSNVTINGQAIGTFSDTGWHDWMVTGIDFSQGFTVTGTIQLSGPFSNSQEKSKVEIKIGHSLAAIPTATNTPEPTATNTPEPTTTNTPEPTTTNTPEPTATNTPEPTTTNTPEPTTTNTPEPTATNTPEPTATNTPEPVVTIIPGPAVTNTPSPSDIPTNSTDTTSNQLFLPIVIRN